jgi:hypothetical protein
LSPALGPGWVGYVGFEAAHLLERIRSGPDKRPDRLRLPTVRMALYDRVIVLDETGRHAFAVRAPSPALSSLHPNSHDADWRERWSAAAALAKAQPPPGTGGAV